MFRFLQKLFPKKASVSVPDTPPENPRLSQYTVFGIHAYRADNKDTSVWFLDDRRGIRKLLVDKNGLIRRFPGIVKEDFWLGEVAPVKLKPRIRFRTDFEKWGDRFIMLWQIQPDGLYWADYGFGIDDEQEVYLYNYIDADGNFTGPFRIYSVGTKNYCLDP